MDTISWKIIEILQQNARISFADLGKAVHLSAPAVAERVKKLEEAGVITGYRANIDLEKVGYPINAMVQVRVFIGKEAEFVKFTKTRQEVLKCYNVTGEKAYMLKVAVQSMSQLDAMLEDFSTLSETNSMIILSTPIDASIIKGKEKSLKI
ncbi:Lrp/AsnC family transcriptional regulator [Aliikangiella coralliicola]|uniref:Lrp/AsnC family transcriptional regulator n=1 Tax=Aliikangiella coralliicola TaxID=2592383 RepID=A0A545UG56_9GAMM|nr:Lrp/AsnC family transcriptional regulator [Aliikangiella coralliicola]TQV88383.1 Lrp/AsnC family transcriptional regulator [Aliikangiella coralliicola]